MLMGHVPSVLLLPWGTWGGGSPWGLRYLSAHGYGDGLIFTTRDGSPLMKYQVGAIILWALAKLGLGQA